MWLSSRWGHMEPGNAHWWKVADFFSWISIFQNSAPWVVQKPFHHLYRRGNFWDFWGKKLEFFGNCLEIVWPIFGPPGGALVPPRGPKMGPGTPGIDLKSHQQISKIWAGGVNFFLKFWFSVLCVFFNGKLFFRFFSFFPPNLVRVFKLSYLRAPGPGAPKF